MGEILRLQNMTPPVYTEESRDFQLLCRLYDCVINGLKFDIDSILELINTRNTRSSALPLLQTKVGFYTDKKIDSSRLRSVLECFPIIVKNKGSLYAIKMSVYLYLRIYKMYTKSNIWYSYDTNFLTVEIITNKKAPSTIILDELFRYILPTGATYSIIFNSAASQMSETVNVIGEAELVFVSDSISSQVRGGSDSPQSSLLNDDASVGRLVSAVDTTSLISSDSSVSSSQFLGYYTSDPTSTTNYSIAIVSSIPKIYVNSGWKTIDFIGNCSSEPTITSDNDGQMIALISGSTTAYKIAVNGSWIDYSSYARYILQTYNIS